MQKLTIRSDIKYEEREKGGDTHLCCVTEKAFILVFLCVFSLED